MTSFLKKLALLCAFLPTLALAQTPTPTPNIGLLIPGYGQQNWQVPVNANFILLDKLLSGNAALPGLWVSGPANIPQLNTWQSTTSYSSGTVVVYLGTFYASTTNGNSGNVPVSGSSYWTTTLTPGITSLTLAVPTWLTVTGSPLTGPGTITIASNSVTQNQFLASPCGSNGALAPRVICPSDLPVATTSTLGAVQPDGSTITVSAGKITTVAGPVLNASSSTVAGSDIGARANTLFTQLLNAGQNGTITLDPTVANGNQTTTITVPLGDTLDCQGATLNWPSTGNQIIYGGTFTSGTQSQQGKVKNCTLIGAGATATAIYAGGDPAGVITPSGNFGNNLTLEHDVIKGFATGYTHGSNSYNNVISNTQFLDNTNNIVSAPTSAANEGEATVITDGSVISNATNCGFYLNNVDDVYYMIGGHLDYNVAGGVCGTAANIELQNVWQEQYFGPFVNVVGPSTAVDVVKSTGGQAVITAAPATITNVAINGTTNVLTITTSAAVTGYLTGHSLAFSGVTTAAFLNGTSGTILSASGTTVTLSYTHATYASASDTGTATPVTADLWHVEGLYETQVIVQNPLIEQPAGTITNAIGLGSTTGTTVCLKDISGPHGYGITGTIYTGCKYQAPLQLNYGPSEAIFSPYTTYQTATQGWNITWNLQLNGLSGEMDFINTHGGGSGGYVFCDGAFNYTPSVCQFSVDTSGDTTALGNSKATQFLYPTVTTGPNGQEWSDLYTTSGLGSGAIGTPTTAGSFTASSTEQDINHPGNVALNSGFSTAGTGIGEYFIGESSGAFAALSLNTTPGWTFDTIVYVPVLPATTAASYEVGLYHNPNILQNSGGGQGFYLSSTNANQNHWYCSYGANVNTDSGVTATSAWTHLSMVQNGTNLLWYINGAQVCSTPIANVTSLTSYTDWKAVAQTETTAVTMYIDEFTFQRALTR